MTLPADAADPVFVGGTGRSGTHAMARLLGRHSRYLYVSREIRFHTEKGGLPDLLAGRVSMRRFLRNMRGHWWDRPGPEGVRRGLHGKVEKEAFEAALLEFEGSFDADPTVASRTLMRALLDPLADAKGRATWVEQTPSNVFVAPTLLQIFPQMKMIHMVRDGRDVACSLAARSWGPNSVARGVRWWAKRMRRADAGERGLPADRLLVVNLEDLVERDREGTYGRVLEFLRVEDEPKIRRYFDKKLTPENANIGRWRSDLSEARQRRLTDSYARTLKRLSAAGVSSTPALEAAEGAGPPR